MFHCLAEHGSNKWKFRYNWMRLLKGVSETYLHSLKSYFFWGGRGSDRMVVGFTTTYVISAYHFKHCELFESRSRRGVLDITLCDKV